MPPVRWWLTVARGEGLCSDCGGFHRPRDPILFSPATRRVLCTTCGDERGIQAPRSRAYLASPHNDERSASTGRSLSTSKSSGQGTHKEVREG